MKTTRYLTLLTLVLLAFAPNSFAQDASPEYVVRVIHFHPNDIEPQEVATILNPLVKDVQQFFADEMERHGFGRKTFRLETDGTGNVVLHRLKGKFSNAHYSQRYGAGRDEIREQFDESKNIIYLVWEDIRHERHLDLMDPIDAYGIDQIGGNSLGNSFRGFAFVGGGNLALETKLLYPRAIVGIAHELGHAFGLLHDFRDDRYILSYGFPTTQNQLSFCATEWLDANRYFNANPISSDRSQTTIDMLSPSLVSSPNTIRLRFKVTDHDGLHQAVLLSNTIDERVLQTGGSRVLDCQSLNGSNTTIEFDTTELGTRSTYVSLRVIDVHGNFTGKDFPIDITPLLQHSEVVSIPDVSLAASVRENLGLGPSDTITKLDMLELTVFIAKGASGLISDPKGTPITNLTGLEHATNLEFLNLANHKVSDITPLTGLTRLKTLIAENNNIKNISSLAGLTQLGTLFISHNEISDIAPLARLTRLTRLDLTRNLIADITPLTGLTNLSILQLNYNKITNEQLAVLTELPKLVVLNLAGNQIRDISPLAALTNVSALDLKDNSIADITALNGLTNLRRLVLSNNEITDVSPLAGLMNLHRLSLEHNQISDVNPLSGLTNLELLNLVGNPIKNRKPLLTLQEKNPDVKIYLKNYDEPLTDILLADSQGNTYLPKNETGEITEPPKLKGDVNNDGIVNILDMVSVATNFGKTGENIADVNGDGIVNIVDLVLVAGEIGGGAAAPSAHPETLENLTAADVQHWLAQAQHANLTDATSQRGILMLQQLLAALIPKETALLANYPNPFNPETWIPYQLSEDAEVTLTIYAVNGQVIRQLSLGHQLAGTYQNKSRAVYWDGRNAVGEPVASGVYFYTLTTGDFSATRKMLIRK